MIKQGLKFERVGDQVVILIGDHATENCNYVREVIFSAEEWRNLLTEIVFSNIPLPPPVEEAPSTDDAFSLIARGTIAEIGVFVAAEENPEALDKLAEAESKVKSRNGVFDLINKRKAELTT